MLRITRVEDSSTTLHLRVEGRLVGDWVGLLEEELARADGSGRRIALDLGEVAFANEAALLVLQRALKDGAELVSCSPLIRALLGGSPQ